MKYFICHYYYYYYYTLSFVTQLPRATRSTTLHCIELLFSTLFSFFLSFLFLAFSYCSNIIYVIDTVTSIISVGDTLLLRGEIMFYYYYCCCCCSFPFSYFILFFFSGSTSGCYEKAGENTECRDVEGAFEHRFFFLKKKV
ncbi:hypothetical protein, unlikely [Trypanosoma brucei gambiense DAL972]|uniref:Uncharacterized protein n=1 Tax=Trypanosoma brucei gambiense (strain MHOM/CI/86/DAL972) TaxID=679716 RepID=C9ZVM4_TRYB9|nr:hypothetical protein, unlikely [Trypanosoma brucei gambiense DAL972]CBH13462.1 hypothetical protein, unlikely [Trypanosoma brucei gambiense DAL972]|eukprot:XP_011775739.1 hypothetical protein, unlikely [Trypanosoma brucei gambiense DAL972]